MIIIGFVSVFGGSLSPQPQQELLTRQLKDQMAFNRALSDERKPSDGIIQKVEAALNGRPCIGRIGQWNRNYSYAVKRDRSGVDLSSVEFRLEKIKGTNGSVKVFRLRDFRSVDDRQFMRVDGLYRRKLGKVEISYCGLNHRS